MSRKKVEKDIYSSFDNLSNFVYPHRILFLKKEQKILNRTVWVKSQQNVIQYYTFNDFSFFLSSA